jgi:hypothetical protein
MATHGIVVHDLSAVALASPLSCYLYDGGKVLVLRTYALQAL